MAGPEQSSGAGADGGGGGAAGPEAAAGAERGVGPGAPARRLLTRRRFLALGAAGGLGIAAATRVGFYGEAARAHEGLRHLTPVQGAILLVVVDAMLPPQADRSPERLRDHVRFIDRYLSGVPADDRSEVGLLLYALEHATLPFGLRLRRLTRLPPSGRRRVLAGWQTSRIGLCRLGLRSVRSLAFLAYYRTHDAFRAVGYGGPLLPGYAGPEASRARYDALLAPPDSEPGFAA